MKIGFDKVYCISYCRNIEKQNNIRKVMKYLGIDFEFIYGADYSNLHILKNKDFVFKGAGILKDDNFKHYTHFIGASYDHYTAIIHAYESGANSVLIMEDDILFINDISYIQWALNNYPKDADIVKFGYLNKYSFKKFKCEGIDLNKTYQFILETNNYNIEFLGSQLYGICNRETMKKYIDEQQNNFQCVDNIPESLKQKQNIKVYGLIDPIGLDYRGNNEDLKKGYKNKYILLENINKKKKKKFIFF